MALSFARHNPSEVQFFTKSYSTLAVACLLKLFSAFYLVLQHCSAGTDTCLLLCIPILFKRNDIREGADTHKLISYK